MPFTSIVRVHRPILHALHVWSPPLAPASPPFATYERSGEGSVTWVADVVVTCRKPGAAAAAITGVHIDGNIVLSSGLDQRLCVWRAVVRSSAPAEDAWEGPVVAVGLELLSSQLHDIADANSAAFMRASGSDRWDAACAEGSSSFCC